LKNGTSFHGPIIAPYISLVNVYQHDRRKICTQWGWQAPLCGPEL
jgi:hypothetical protein